MKHTLVLAAMVFVGCATTENGPVERTYSFLARSGSKPCGDVATFTGPASAICERAVKNETDTEVLCDDLEAGVYVRDMYVDPKPAADGSHWGLYQVTTDACSGVYDVTVR